VFLTIQVHFCRLSYIKVEKYMSKRNRSRPSKNNPRTGIINKGARYSGAKIHDIKATIPNEILSALIPTIITYGADVICTTANWSGWTEIKVVARPKIEGFTHSGIDRRHANQILVAMRGWKKVYGKEAPFSTPWPIVTVTYR
jgi:hypothetical protein